MRRSVAVVLACLALVAVLTFVGWKYLGPRPGLGGVWKVTQIDNTDATAITYWLVEVNEHGARALASADDSVKPETVEVTQNDAEALRLTFHTPEGQLYRVVGYVPAGNAAPGRLLGSVEINGQRSFALLERTDERQLDRKKLSTSGPAAQALQKARNLSSAADSTAALEELAQRYPNEPAAHVALMALLDHARSAERAQDLVGRAVAAAGTHGREMECATYHRAADACLTSPALLGLGLEYARKAEECLRPSDLPDMQAAVVRTLALALRMNGQREQAVALNERIAGLLEQIVQVQPFPDRSGGNKRVAVVELFTGAECGVCVAADLAFDALPRTFSTADVVALEYHVNIPRPDPLANPETKARSEYYGIKGTPTLFLNGKPGPEQAGMSAHAQARYQALRQAVAEKLEQQARARLELTASRLDDRIDMVAEVSGVQEPSDDLCLRFVLVEDTVSYAGGNGQFHHHQVVRAFPGGVDGFPLKTPAARHAATIKVSELRRSLDEYLGGFPQLQRSLGLDHLRVVALVQNNQTKQILQAAQAELK